VFDPYLWTDQILNCVLPRSFAQAGPSDRRNDAFSPAYRPPQVRQRVSQSAEVTPSSSQRQTSRTLSNWRSDNGESSNSGSPTNINQTPTAEASGTGTRISGQNAQSFFEASACVFVAK
jgi:hypothetical protein